jgi:hypothetical protein
LAPISPDNEDNGFHVTNTSLTDWQRESVIQRDGAVDVRCDLVGVLHGWYGAKNDNGPFATLVVFRFRFDPQNHSRRVIRCKATIETMAWDANSTRPEVKSIAPGTKYELEPTVDPEDVEKGFSAKLEATGLPIVGGSIGGDFKKSGRRENPDSTTVSGSIGLAPGLNSGKRNSAGWTLLENKTRSTGLPDSLRVAILLERADKKPFKLMVRMECKADFTTGIGWFFGSFPLDDPVLFNPDLKAQGILQDYGAENMSSFNLQKLADVTFRTEYVGARKNTGGGGGGGGQ